jgi:hypothetical protein
MSIIRAAFITPVPTTDWIELRITSQFPSGAEPEGHYACLIGSVGDRALTESALHRFVRQSERLDHVGFGRDALLELRFPRVPDSDTREDARRGKCYG